MTDNDNITKICSKCKIEKNSSSFWVRKERKGGLYSACIKCKTTAALNKKRTKSGLVYSIYGDQLSTSKKRKHVPPSYTAEELFEFLTTNQEFNEIYNGWVSSGYKKMLRPSIDRNNDYLPYSFDNITVMTWQENMDKGHKDRVTGINNKMNKSVNQLNKDKTFIKNHHSMMQAERETGVSSGKICICCKGKRKSAGGFIWEYAKL